jgi:uncharacterized membrane protein YfcA
MMCLFAAIVGIPVGLYMVSMPSSLPFAWVPGAFVLLVSVGYLISAFVSKETAPEEHEKPLMDVATEPDYEDEEDDEQENEE